MDINARTIELRGIITRLIIIDFDIRTNCANDDFINYEMFDGAADIFPD